MDVISKCVGTSESENNDWYFSYHWISYGTDSMPWLHVQGLDFQLVALSWNYHGNEEAKHNQLEFGTAIRNLSERLEMEPFLYSATFRTLFIY